MDTTETRVQPASIGKLSDLREEFVKLKDSFDNQIKIIKNECSVELKRRDRKINILRTKNQNLVKRIAAVISYLMVLSSTADAVLYV